MNKISHSKFSILLRKAGLIAILAVLVLGIIPIQTTAQNIIVQPPPTSPFAQGGVLYQTKQITFNIKTDGTIYRAVKGKKINISTEASLVSPEGLKVGDKIDRPKNDTIQGFYVASVGQGATDICGAYNPFVGGVIGYIIWGGCHFEAVAKPSATELPFKQTLELNTSESQYPIGKRKIWVFPVLDLSGTVGATDEPYTNAPVTATLEIYSSQAELDAAAKAAGDTNPYVSGSVGNSTTSATGGKGIGDTFTGTLISILNIIIGAVVTIVGSIIKYLGAIIIVPILEATLSMDASQFAGGPILAGWTLVRDAVNMFFILFLIIVGFGTILKIESYNYKKLLVNLVVMALLVNFSLVIARIILQVSDTAQFSFLPVSTVVEGGEGMTGVRYLYQKLSTEHLSKIVDGFRVFSTSTSGALAGTMTILFEFILQLAVVITFGAMAAFMLIRTVAIYILLVLSPLAFALLVVPATKSTAQKWWSNYIKYVLFGPIFAFFLRLDFEIYARGMKLLPSLFDKTITNPDTVDYLNLLKSQNGGVTFAQMLQLGTLFVLILAFKWAELLIAKDMGIAGANAIVGLAEKGLKAPFAGGWGVTKFGGRALDQWLAKGTGKKGPGVYNALRRAGSYLSPQAWKRGWDLRKKQKEFEAYTEAGGARADLFNRVISRERTDFQLRGQQARVNDELKNIHTKNREELATLYEQARQEGNPYKALAYANRMAQNYDLNELLSYRGYTTDQAGLQEMIKKDMSPLMGEQAAYRAGYDLSRMAEEVHHWNMARAYTGKYDPQTKDIVYEPNAEAGREVQIELSKAPRRDQVGRGNRLAWGFAETDIPDPDNPGQTIRVQREWNQFGRERWKGEVADTEFRNQFTMNAAMNILLKESKDALKSNKVAWLNLVDTKAAKLTDPQLMQWRTRIARPKAGWKAAERDDQVFSMETVHKYRTERLPDGTTLLSDKDFEGRNVENLTSAYEEWHQQKFNREAFPKRGGSPASAPAGSPAGGAAPSGGGGVAPPGGGTRGGGPQSGPQPATEASVKFILTRRDLAELRRLGYSQDQINKMTPAEGQKIIAGASPPSTTT